MPDGNGIEDGHERRQVASGSLAGTNLERAGGYNERVTLQAIRVNSPVTRTELAELTGLTAPAIANITKRLIDKKLIRQAGRVKGARGQPAIKLVINAEGRHAIGLNIDRDHITVVAVDFFGDVKARATKNIDFALPGQVVDFFAETVNGFLKDKKIPRSSLMGVGIAVPDGLGTVESNDRPEAYAQWAEIDIAALIAPVLKVPVFVENDATAAAIGEMQFGQGLYSASFLYLLVTAGLGGGLVIDGNYIRGAHGRSGEIGYLPARGDTGRTLSEVVSIAALHKHLARRGLDASDLDRTGEWPAPLQAAVDEWLAMAAEALTGPLIAAACLLDPDAVFIGGRLPAWMVENLADRLNRRIAASDVQIPTRFRIERAELSADAPAVGAAILPFSDMLLPNRDSLMKVVAG